jgi:aspartyl-tRNA(Asn)/glutamyl-tRNA(Gln) amidotransferase subunit C
MSVSLDDVRRIAALARLTVDDDRATALTAQLNGILAHMDVLQQVPALDHDPVDDLPGMPLAPDAGPPVPLTRSPAAIAPAWRDGFFLVPRLATHTGQGAADVEDDG